MARGQFTILDLAPGPYKLTVSYIGFAPFSTDVAVSAGGVARVDAVLQIGMQNEAVTVRGGSRARRDRSAQYRLPGRLH